MLRWFSQSVMGFFATPIGVVILAAADSTLFFSLPFGIDAAIVVLAARQHKLAWIIPLLATGSSLAGAALTFWMGVKIGEKGLDLYAPPRRLKKIRDRIRKSGAVLLAAFDLIPPPFPFTLFVLAAGALEVRASTFFITLGVCRLVRFGAEALLAVIYGPQLLFWLDSDIFHDIVAGAIVLAVALTVLSMLRFVRATRSPRRRGASA
jgi:membrane protein YqaA with SNARE-associated domain